jgi:hypothetical protein
MTHSYPALRLLLATARIRLDLNAALSDINARIAGPAMAGCAARNMDRLIQVLNDKDHIDSFWNKIVSTKDNADLLSVPKPIQCMVSCYINDVEDDQIIRMCENPKEFSTAA